MLSFMLFACDKDNDIMNTDATSSSEEKNAEEYYQRYRTNDYCDIGILTEYSDIMSQAGISEKTLEDNYIVPVTSIAVDGYVLVGYKDFKYSVKTDRFYITRVLEPEEDFGIIEHTGVVSYYNDFVVVPKSKFPDTFDLDKCVEIATIFINLD